MNCIICQKKIKKKLNFGANDVFDNDYFYAKYISNRNASIFFGRNTKWCISQKSPNAFDKYVNDNSVFYFGFDKIESSRDSNKFAIVFIRNTDNEIIECKLFNPADVELNQNNFITGLAKEKIKPFLEMITYLRKLAEKIPMSFMCKLLKNKILDDSEIEKNKNIIIDNLDELYKNGRSTEIKLIVCLCKKYNISDKFLEDLNKYGSSSLIDKQIVNFMKFTPENQVLKIKNMHNSLGDKDFFEFLYFIVHNNIASLKLLIYLFNNYSNYEAIQNLVLDKIPVKILLKNIPKFYFSIIERKDLDNKDLSKVIQYLLNKKDILSYNLLSIINHPNISLRNLEDILFTFQENFDNEYDLLDLENDPHNITGKKEVNYIIQIIKEKINKLT